MQQAVRAVWVEKMRRVAEPVLTAAAARELRARMPVEGPAAEKRRSVTHLEAVGRLLCGIAPWLESTLPAGATGAEETALQERYQSLAQKTLDAIADPESPDVANWDEGRQPLVDAAFLAHALIRAPRAMWEQANEQTQRNLIAGLERTRVIQPGMSNWLLFSAMVEAALYRFSGEYKPEPVAFALEQHESWYKGDGVYGDGPEFHWDYYNSFVIQPMLIDVLEAFAGQRPEWYAMLPRVLGRATRYAAIQERLIAPDGSYPIIGRSICYRCGAFQLLAQMALRQQLPEQLPPSQVRDALTAVIQCTLDSPGTFDAGGWLRPGLSGHQLSLAEGYISTGSLYLCSTAFLPLGLPADAAFWAGPPTPWTSRRVWELQEDLPADHAYREGGH